MDNDAEKSLNIFITVVALAICFTVITINKKKDSKPPINEKVEKTKKENDKLITEVKHLDSIKNAKVIEVKSLSNDSTLELFYKLIK